jgi:molybdopterin-guanine dinucleotide biosynthesis protein MobB
MNKLETAQLPVIGIVGWSGSGKTSWLELLIPELKKRGFRIATIKHTGHRGVVVDKEGSDTWRHAQAGSDVVVLATPDRLVITEKLAGVRLLEVALQRIANRADIILVEGFKSADIPQIEVVADPAGERVSHGGKLVAVVLWPGVEAKQVNVDVTVPILGWEEIGKAGDLVVSITQVRP